MPVPILETQRTAEPGDATYSTRKAELEQTLLAGPAALDPHPRLRDPRPGREELPRELFFVKRAVDGRRRVALAWNGESRFHTTSVANLAELIRLAAAQPGDRVLNARRSRPADDARDLPRDRQRARATSSSRSCSRRTSSTTRGASAAAVHRLDGGRGTRARLPAGDDVPRSGRETCAWLVGELERGRSWDGHVHRRDARLRGRGRGAGVAA